MHKLDAVDASVAKAPPLSAPASVETLRPEAGKRGQNDTLQHCVETPTLSSLRSIS